VGAVPVGGNFEADSYMLIMKANEMHYFSNLFDEVFRMTTLAGANRTT
jgi:hypothetical protein